MLLPKKASLRKAVKPLSEPPREALAYFQTTRGINLVAVCKTLRVENKRVFTILFYERSAGLKYATFINRSFEVVTLKVATPFKWYQTFEGPRARRWNYKTWEYEGGESAKLINAGSYFTYFATAHNKYPFEKNNFFSWLKLRIDAKKSVDSEKRIYATKEKKRKMFESRFNPVNKRFLKWAYSLYDRGTFDVNNRFNGYCTECGHNFISERPLKHGQPFKCPSCGAHLTMCSIKKATKEKEFAAQYIDRDKNGTLTVRHFLIYKNYLHDKAEPSYFEYERDTFDPDVSDNGIFRYHIKRWDGYWYNTKPSQYSRWQMKNICYIGAPLYRGNFKKVLLNDSDSRFIHSAIEYMPKDYMLRSEEYLCSYCLAPTLVEKLVKAGYFSVEEGTTYRELKVNKNKTLKELFADITPEYKQFIKSKRYFSMSLLEKVRQLVKNNVSINQLAEFAEIEKQHNNYISDFSIDFALNLIEKFRVANVTRTKALNYLKVNDLHMWKDYVSSTLYVLCDNSVKKNALLPKNLKKAHDDMVKAEKEIRDKREKERIAKLDKFCQKVYQFFMDSGLADYKKGGYAIVFPKNRADFIKEGTNLSNCVGSHFNYFEEHALKKGLIFFVRKEDDITHSYVCVEARVVANKLSISQCYGYGNDLRLGDKETPGKIVKPFATKFVDELNKVLRFKNNKYIMPTAA